MNMDKYENKMPYPERIKKPVISRNPTAEEAEKYASDLRNYEKEMVSYNAARASYSAEGVRLEECFKNDLFLEYVKTDGDEISDDVRKKAEVIYAKAWEDGHSSGFSEVEIYFSNLVDFARDLGVDV
jgi:hypothetical protein